MAHPLQPMAINSSECSAGQWLEFSLDGSSPLPFGKEPPSEIQAWDVRLKPTGRLLLTGTLGFILYTYITMSFGAAYNKLFLVYVALFSLSLFAFIFSMMSFDLETLPTRFLENLPRGWIAGLLFFAAAFLSLAWLGRIAATFAPDAIPALENTTSMFIQAMDLGIVVPLCVLSGVLLMRRSAWGYLLASVSLMKFLTMGIAVSLMSLNMARVGVPISAVELAVFPTITLANLVMVTQLLRNIKE